MIAMLTYLLAALTAFVIVLLLGPVVLPLLHRLKFGQIIREVYKDPIQILFVIGALPIACIASCAALFPSVGSVGFFICLFLFLKGLCVCHASDPCIVPFVQCHLYGAEGVVGAAAQFCGEIASLTN